jgi:hypothetical protein
LLQRVLAAHSRVATASEPWVLLPLLGPLYGRLPAPGARDPLIHEALVDFVGQLPRAAEDYRAAVRGLANALYGQIADGRADYFVDKTPLYHLILDEIFAAFPDGKFVFLFRNPLSVVASCVELFDGGRWEAPRYHMALFQSFADLAPGAERYATRSMKLRFEDLVTGDAAVWRGVVDYLELGWEPQMLQQFTHVDLRGRMGDRTGAARYVGLSREPVERWRATVCNPLRRAWCDRYLVWLGRERLATMGYDLDALRAELASTGMTTAHCAEDAKRLAVSLVREGLKAHVPRYTSRASTWRALLGARPGDGVGPG